MSNNAPKDSPRNLFFAAFLTFIFTISATYYGNIWQERSHVKMDLRNKRFQVFTELVGSRIPLTQAAMSFQESRIFHQYHQAKWLLTHDKLNLEEAKRLVQRSETLNSDLGKERRRLYELVASIFVLFPELSEQELLSSRLSQIGILAPPPDPKDIRTLSGLEAWRVQQIQLASDHIESEFGKPIGQLMDHIAPIIRKESLILQSQLDLNR